MSSLTVVVPFWDLPDQLLQRALDSVERAAPRGTIVVVVDNASAARPKCAADDIIRLPHRVTVGAARNAGLSAVQTRYCLFLDADDELLPGAASALVDVARRDDLQVVAGRILGRREGLAGAWLWGYPPGWVWRLRNHPRALGVVNVYRNAVPVVGAAVLRTDAARRAGGFGDSNRGEDWVLSAGMALAGSAALLDWPCLLVQVRPDSLSTKDESESAARRTRREVRGRLYRAGPLAGLLALSAVPIHVYSARRRARHRHSEASGRPGTVHT